MDVLVTEKKTLLEPYFNATSIAIKYLIIYNFTTQYVLYEKNTEQIDLYLTLTTFPVSHPPVAIHTYS